MDTKLVHCQAGVLLRGYQLSVGVAKIIFFLYPFFKPLKISFKFTFGTLSGTNLHIWTPNRYYEHPSPPPPRRTIGVAPLYMGFKCSHHTLVKIERCQAFVPTKIITLYAL